MTLAVWVGTGIFGAIGALARFWVGGVVAIKYPSDFPAGTFVVNLSGSFALGLLTGVGLESDVLMVLGTGFLGGYTTFSTWMVETQRLGEDGEQILICVYLFGSLLAGLATASVGWLLGGLLA
jgi:fluoride exporter